MRGERVGGDVDADAFAFLVRLGAGQQHAQSVRPEGEVRHPDHHQLGAAEGAGEAEQNEGAVAFAAPVAAADRGHPQHVGGEQRCGLALGPGTVAPGDALQGPRPVSASSACAYQEAVSLPLATPYAWGRGLYRGRGGVPPPVATLPSTVCRHVAGTRSAACCG